MHDGVLSQMYHLLHLESVAPTVLGTVLGADVTCPVCAVWGTALPVGWHTSISSLFANC